MQHPALEFFTGCETLEVIISSWQLSQLGNPNVLQGYSGCFEGGNGL